MLRKKINTTGGISQQPNSLRLPNQVTSCDNFYTNYLLQTSRRKGIQHVKELVNGDNLVATDQYYVWEVRGNKYLVAVIAAADGGTTLTGRVKVWDLSTGTQIAVTRSAANYDYTVPSSGNRSDNIKLIQDGDDLWILNKTMNPVLTTAVSGGGSGSHYVFLKQGNFNTDYKIKVKYVVSGTPYEATSYVKTWTGQTIADGNAAYFIAQHQKDGVSFSAAPQQPNGGILGSIKTDDIIQQLKYNLDAEIAYTSGNGKGKVDSIDIIDPGAGYPTSGSVNISIPHYSTGVSTVVATANFNSDGVIGSTTITSTAETFSQTDFLYRLAYPSQTLITGGKHPRGIPVISGNAVTGGTTIDNGSLNNAGNTTIPSCNVLTSPGASLGSGGTLTATVNSNKQITTYAVTAAGSGYYYNPTATIAASSPAASRVGVVKVYIKNTQIKIERLGTASSSNANANPYLNSILKLTPEAGITITSVETTDSLGNTVLEVVGPKAPRVQGYLPEEFEDGVVIEVMGDGEASEDNYFVKFQTISGETFGKGHWIETIKPGEIYALNNTTLPHKLTWNAAGTALTYNTATWSDRTVGELATVPMPSVVFSSVDSAAEPIRDMVVYKDRLCFINKKSLVMSETGEHTNIFRTTMLQVLDTDPIDLDVGDRLNSIVEYPIGLIAFTDNDQTVIRGSDVLSPRTVEVQTISNWDNLHGNNISPVDSGTSLYFLTQSGSFCGVKEMSLNQQGMPQIMEITSAVPTLIPTTPTMLTASAQNGMVIVNSSADVNKLYVYRHMGKALSSWTTWTLGANFSITNIKIADNYLYITYLNNSHCCIGTINLTEDPSTARYFDKYVTLSGGVYNAGENKTSYDLTAQNPVTSFASTDSLGALDIVNNIFYTVEKITVTSIKLAGDTTAKTILFGAAYNSTMELTKPYFSEDVNQSLRGINVYYNSTNQTLVNYVAGSRATQQHTMAAATSAETTTVALKTGNEFFPITGDPSKAVITFTTQAYGSPCNLEVIEYLYIIQKSG